MFNASRAPWSRLVCWSALLLLGACRLHLKPAQSLVAVDASYQMSLLQLQGGMPRYPDVDGIEADLRVDDWQEGTTITGVSVAKLASKPCSTAWNATYWRVPGVESKRLKEPLEPQVGQTVQVGLPRDTWRPLVGGPYRLDVEVTDKDGILHCASFPVGNELAETRWAPNDSWTLSPFMGLDIFSSQLDGLTGTVYGGGELGKWSGPFHLAATVGGGSSQCDSAVCAPPGKDRVSNSYYVPLSLGVDVTLVELWVVTVDVRGHYRLGFTAADTRDGRQKLVLHGPLLTPSIGLSMPALALPFGVRGLHSAPRFSVQAPLGFIMSSAGGSTFSVGMVVAFEFPLR